MKKKYSQVTYILLAVVIFGSLVIAAVSSNGTRGQNTDPQSAAAVDERRALVDAIRRGGYREAARIKGHYVGTFDPHWDWVQLDIESLAKNSEAIVVGTPSKNLGGHLAAGGQSIATDFEMTVQEVIKGDIRQGSNIKVTLPGGRVNFEDGTSAEIKATGFEPMVEGKTYTLFLYKEKTDSDAFSLVAGPQGLFGTAASDQKVKAHGRPTDPATEETKDKTTESFLIEIRKQAQKWPQPKKCCD